MKVFILKTVTLGMFAVVLSAVLATLLGSFFGFWGYFLAFWAHILIIFWFLMHIFELRR